MEPFFRSSYKRNPGRQAHIVPVPDSTQIWSHSRGHCGSAPEKPNGTKLSYEVIYFNILHNISSWITWLYCSKRLVNSGVVEELKFAPRKIIKLEVRTSEWLEVATLSPLIAGLKNIQFSTSIAPALSRS